MTMWVRPALAALPVVALALVGCQPTGTQRAAGQTSVVHAVRPTTRPPAPTTAPTSRPSQTGTLAPPSTVPAGTPGSVTVSLSAPVALAGTVATPVTYVTGGTYRASAGTPQIQGVQVSFAVTAAGYHGGAATRP